MLSSDTSLGFTIPIHHLFSYSPFMMALRVSSHISGFPFKLGKRWMGFKGQIKRNNNKTTAILLHVRRKIDDSSGVAVGTSQQTHIHEWIWVNDDGTNPKPLFSSEALFDPSCVLVGSRLYVIGGHRIEGEELICTNTVHRLELSDPLSQWEIFTLPFSCSSNRTAVVGESIYLFADYFPFDNVENSKIEMKSKWVYVYRSNNEQEKQTVGDLDPPPPYLSPEGPPKVVYCSALDDKRVMVWFLSPPSSPSTSCSNLTAFIHNSETKEWEDRRDQFSPPAGHNIVSHAVSDDKRFLYLFSTCWATPFLSGYNIHSGALLFRLEIKGLDKPLSERDESGYPLEMFTHAQLVVHGDSNFYLLGHWDRGGKEGSFFSITISVSGDKPSRKLSVKKERPIKLVAHDAINIIPLTLVPSLLENMKHMQWSHVPTTTPNIPFDQPEAKNEEAIVVDE